MGVTYHIAVDLGATSGRVILASFSGTKVTFKEISRFKYPMLPVGGCLFWNLPQIFLEVKTAIDSVIRDFARKEKLVSSIGIDTWGCDVAFFYKDGSLAGLPYCYRNSFTAGATARFAGEMPPEELYSRTGIQFLDFNSTSFSHPKSGDLTLANPDKGIRDFWVEHSMRCREIAQAIGEAQHDPCILNTWVHDGSKDLTVCRYYYRELLKESLDRIFEHPYDWMKDTVESKVFGIGLESYTVGSNDFYTAYASKRDMMITLDTGHFHPTESVADKVSAMLLFVPELMLHVSRPVRWDSDHVTIMDDPTLDLFSEIVRAGALNRVHYGLDYFDGTLNRIGAYVIGSRAAQKCMLRAMLEPTDRLCAYELADRKFQRLAMLEEAKCLPWNAVYDMFCLRNGVPVGNDYIREVEKYETEVTSKR